MTVGTDFILNAFVKEGQTHLFMVPGGLVDPFLAALARQPKLQPIAATLEGAAAYMADGYTRASSQFGAALGIGSPGLFSASLAPAANSRFWEAGARGESYKLQLLTQIARTLSLQAVRLSVSLLLICFSFAVFAERRIFILNADGNCPRCASLVEKMLASATPPKHAMIVNPREMMKQMKQGDVLVVPGGYDYDKTIPQLQKLKADKFIRKHIEEGGIYIGHCLGADIADKKGLNIFRGRITDPAPEEYRKEGQAVKLAWKGRERYAYFYDGPKFQPDKKMYRSPWNLKVLATYRETKKETGMNAGDAAAITYDFGKGKVLLISPHPEADEHWYQSVTFGRDKLKSLNYDLGLDLYNSVMEESGAPSNDETGNSRSSK